MFSICKASLRQTAAGWVPLLNGSADYLEQNGGGQVFLFLMPVGVSRQSLVSFIRGRALTSYRTSQAFDLLFLLTGPT